MKVGRDIVFFSMIFKVEGCFIMWKTDIKLLTRVAVVIMAHLLFSFHLLLCESETIYLYVYLTSGSNQCWIGRTVPHSLPDWGLWVLGLGSNSCIDPSIHGYTSLWFLEDHSNGKDWKENFQWDIAFRTWHATLHSPWALDNARKS